MASMRTGPLGKKVVKCFGFKLHLVVDADYDLPVAFTVTRASASDAVKGHQLMDKLLAEQKEMVRNCQYLSADKGYDDTKLIGKLRSVVINEKFPFMTEKIPYPKDDQEKP